MKQFATHVTTLLVMLPLLISCSTTSSKLEPIFWKRTGLGSIYARTNDPEMHLLLKIRQSLHYKQYQETLALCNVRFDSDAKNAYLDNVKADILTNKIINLEDALIVNQQLFHSCTKELLETQVHFPDTFELYEDMTPLVDTLFIASTAVVTAIPMTFGSIVSIFKPDYEESCQPTIKRFIKEHSKEPKGKPTFLLNDDEMFSYFYNRQLSNIKSDAQKRIIQLYKKIGREDEALKWAAAYDIYPTYSDTGFVAID